MSPATDTADISARVVEPTPALEGFDFRAVTRPQAVHTGHHPTHRLRPVRLTAAGGWKRMGIIDAPAQPARPAPALDFFNPKR